MRKTVAIIQARMGSSRLPGKVLKELQGMPMIWHIITRVKMALRIDEVIVATTKNMEDDDLWAYLTKKGVACFRGSNENVLERFYLAAKKYKATTVVRLTGDNPLIDPKIIDDTINYFFNNSFRYVSNVLLPAGRRTLPLGLGCEIFSFELLEETYLKANCDYEKEHVTPYMYLKQNSIGCYSLGEDLSKYHFTVDTIEEFAFLNEIYRRLYFGKHDFWLEDIIKYLDMHPELISKMNILKGVKN